MHRQFLAVILASFGSLAAFAGEDPATAALGIAKKLAAIPTLTELSLKPLMSADEDVRKEFFKSLDTYKISEGNRMAISGFVAKKDPSDDVRLAAAQHLLKSKDGKIALATMSALLGDKSPALRRLACESLTGYRGDPTLGPRFAKALYDPAPEVRLAAVRALGKLGDRKQVPTIVAAYKKFKTDGDDDAPFGEALASLGETDVSLDIARVCIKSRNLPRRIAAAGMIEDNPSLKVIPVIMENLVLELRRTTTLDSTKADWDVVYVTMCSELRRRTGQDFGNDAVAWCKWWEGVRAKYNAPAPAFDAVIVGRWMEQYRTMGPSKLRQ